KHAALLSLNTLLRLWAEQANAKISPVYLVDHFSGFDPVADLRDGLHPNRQGDVKMAQRWHPAMVRAALEVMEDRKMEWVMEKEREKEMAEEGKLERVMEKEGEREMEVGRKGKGVRKELRRR
ncbi:MAG: hypothetical protein LQ340_008126, partial [Diploschistes diacapsis]